MNFSNFKLALYDLLGLTLPGMFFICEGWVGLRGWRVFTERLGALNPVSFTLFLAGSFVVGHFIQELADWTVKRICGERFLRKGRDEVWVGADGEAVKSAIWAESSLAVGSVDFAFDYCLTRIGEAFPKRDVFVATSDFARSFVVLAVFSLPAAFRLLWDRSHSGRGILLLLSFYVLTLIVALALAWRRMVRFRYISDRAVFGAYLGSRPAKNATPAEAK